MSMVQWRSCRMGNQSIQWAKTSGNCRLEESSCQIFLGVFCLAVVSVCLFVVFLTSGILHATSCSPHRTSKAFQTHKNVVSWKYIKEVPEKPSWSWLLLQWHWNIWRFLYDHQQVWHQCLQFSHNLNIFKDWSQSPSHLAQTLNVLLPSFNTWRSVYLSAGTQSIAFSWQISYLEVPLPLAL